MASDSSGRQLSLRAFEPSLSGTEESLPAAPDRVEEPTERQQQQLIDRVVAYARRVDLAVDIDAIEWEVSTNAQRTRRAGDCRYTSLTERLVITLTWAAYAAWEWDAFAKVVRHELVHAYQFAETGQSDHGRVFRLLAESVDAPMYCQPFTTGRLQLRCGEGCTTQRSKACKVVKYPAIVRCGPHDESMTVEHIATGRTWTDHEGYERQRAAIEGSSEAAW